MLFFHYPYEGLFRKGRYDTIDEAMKEGKKETDIDYFIIHDILNDKDTQHNNPNYR